MADITDAPARRDRHRGHDHASGSSRSATRSPRTSRCSRCRPTRSTPRCRRRSPARSPRSGCPRARPSTSAPCSPCVGDAGAGAAPPRRPRPAEAAAAEPAAEPSRRRRPARGRAAEPEPAAARRRRRAARAPAPDGRRPPRRAGAGARRPAAAPAAATRRAALLSPVVRRLVDEHGLDPAAITGTGPGGRITRDDVLAAVDGPAARRRPPRPPPRPRPRRAAAGRARARAGRAGARAGGARGRRDGRRARHGRAAHQDPQAHRRAHGDVEGDVAPRLHASSRSTTRTSSGCAGRHKDEWKAEEGFSLTYLPFIARAVVDALARVPAPQRQRRRRASWSCTTTSTSASPSTSTTRAFVPVIRDADDKRLRAIAREINDLADRARTKKLVARRDHRRHVHDHQHRARPARAHAADHQPAAGGDPLHRRRAAQAGGRRPTPDGSEAIAIHPVGNLAMTLGPPGLRRRLRRRLPRARSRRSSRPGTGPPSSNGADAPCRCASAGWGGCRYREALRAPAGPVRHGRPTTTCCCSSTRTCSRSGVRADLGHVLVDPGRRSAPSSCAPTAAATSPTTGPGQLVGYPILTVPGKRGGGLADTVAYVRSVEQLRHRRARRPRPARRRPARRLPGRVGRPRTRRSPARSAPSACGSAGAARCTASPSTSTPTWRCSATSCPCGIADKARHVAGRPRASTSRCARSSTPSPPGPPSAGAAAAAERADVAWRHAPDDLSPFSRGRRSEAAGRRAGAPSPQPARLAEAGVTDGLAIASRKPEWLRAKVRLGAEYLRSSARCATSASSPCARRPAARTCPSAGPTARPRS